MPRLFCENKDEPITRKAVYERPLSYMGKRVTGCKQVSSSHEDLKGSQRGRRHVYPREERGNNDVNSSDQWRGAPHWGSIRDGENQCRQTAGTALGPIVAARR